MSPEQFEAAYERVIALRDLVKAKKRVRGVKYERTPGSGEWWIIDHDGAKPRRVPHDPEDDHKPITPSAPGVAVVGLDTSPLRNYLEFVGEHGADGTVEKAFETWAFGSKSEPRVRTLLNTMRRRLDIAPGALDALTKWRRSGTMDGDDLRVVNHWHALLTDPLYRDFVTDHLSMRDKLGKHASDAWVRDRFPDASPAYRQSVASALRTAVKQVGLYDRKGEKAWPPRVSRHALAYGVHLLRALRQFNYEHPIFYTLNLDTHRALRLSPDFSHEGGMGVFYTTARHEGGLRGWADSLGSEGST